MPGYIAISRDIWDDPDFPSETFSQREAWMWMIAQAAWKPHKARRGSHVVHLDRGQLAHSVRFMAEAWGWHRSRVERFLKALENRDSIETHAETHMTIISICKYDAFQNAPSDRETAAEDEPRQQRDTAETDKNQDNQINQRTQSKDEGQEADRISKASSGASKGAAGSNDPDFPKVWKAWPNDRLGRKPAYEAFKKEVKAQGREIVLEGLRGFLRDPNNQGERAQYVPGLKRVLGEQRYLEHVGENRVQQRPSLRNSHHSDVERIG